MTHWKSFAALGVALVVAVALQAAATATATTAATASAASTSHLGDCSQIRKKYPGLPQTISVAVSPYNPPYEEVDASDPNKILGLEPSILSDVAGCLGLKYTYTAGGFASTVAGVQSGREDVGITDLYVTPARAKVFYIVGDMNTVDRIALTPSVASKVRSVNDLCGLTVAEEVGDVEAVYAQKLSAECVKRGKPKMTVDLFQDQGTTYLNLENNRVDAVIDSEITVGQEAKKFPTKIIAGPHAPALTFIVGMGVSPKQPTLARAIAAATAELQKLGIEQKLVKKAGLTASAVSPAKLYGPSAAR